MQLRRLPILAATLAPLSGCALFEPIIGDWEVIDVELYGSSTYYGDIDVEGEMEVDEELLGEFEVTLSATYDTTDGDTETSRYHVEFELSAENEGDGEYTIELEEKSDGAESEMSCELDGAELECDVEDEGITFLFEKQK